ncbi:MAG TPA: GTP cyclohydrolase FolE2 [Rhodocyclaceae bacterium]|nr:GTP cyclohydrolase FolE2 [Rhodocyclaceae bacterium]
MNAPEKIHLPDVQASPDQRRLAIQHVGVRGLRYPLQLKGQGGTVQGTVASVEMTVGLPPEVKGTHMSRFVEILEAQQTPLAVSELPQLLADMLLRLEADSGRIEFAFPWFMRKAAPVSGVQSLLDYDVRLSVACAPGGTPRVDIEVVAPVTSLCPCSKQISAYGAHNQRSLIAIRAEVRDTTLALDTLVRIAEEEASCEVFGLLKRPDEKWVTERAYDNPKFVEDLVRDIAIRLQAEPRIGEWRVSSENFESIHNHSAYAVIEGSNRT